MKDIKKKAQELSPTLRIGKSGISEGLIKEISAQLKRKKLVKIKLLKPALEETSKDELIQHVAKETGAVVVTKVGGVFTLYKA